MLLPTTIKDIKARVWLLYILQMKVLAKVRNKLCVYRGRWKSEAVCWLSKQIPGQVEQTAGHESWVHFCFVLCCFFLSFLCQGLNRWVLTWTISGNDLLPLWRSWRCTWKCMEVRWVMWVGNCMKLLGLLMRKPTKIHTLTTPSTPAIRPAISSQPDITISEFFLHGLFLRLQQSSCSEANEQQMLVTQAAPRPDNLRILCALSDFAPFTDRTTRNSRPASAQRPWRNCEVVKSNQV